MAEKKPETLPVRGQPDYGAHCSGRIWSTLSGRFLKGTKCGQGGYRAVQFPDGSRRYIHRMICEAFHGPAPTKGHYARHLNGDNTDNRPENLAWGTPSENNLDKRRHGTAPVGERNPMARLTSDTVRDMRECRRRTGLSYKNIAARYGVSTMTAFRAITKRSWA